MSEVASVSACVRTVSFDSSRPVNCAQCQRSPVGETISYESLDRSGISGNEDESTGQRET
jgi:hypothetical protein